MAATLPAGPAQPLSPTGLTSAQLHQLDDDELELLAAWHMTKAGDDEGRPWWPAAVRRLPLDRRLWLAGDADADAAWEELMTREVRDLHFFVEQFGHLQPPTGPPIPFDFWPEQPGVRDRCVGAATQREVLTLMLEELRLIMLKARQLGMTWLALHFAVWLMAFNPETPNARVLALSKHGQDATKLRARVARILRLLPPFLRPIEKPETRSSLSKLALEGGGSLTSLAGTASAARMETATLTLLDEFAFVINKGARATWTAAQPTLGETGQAIILSTGNGPPETPGDGQAFAQLWTQARGADAAPAAAAAIVDADVEGEPDEAPLDAAGLVPVFLPSSVHPARTEAWRIAERAKYLTDEDFETEYPEDEDQALQGQGGLKVYSPAGINAAARLGETYDNLLWAGDLEPAGDGLVAAGIDWGEYTGIVPIWPLEDGGIYVPPGEVFGGGHTGMTVRDSAQAFLDGIEPWQAGDPSDPDVPPILLEEARYDSAGVESMRTFIEFIEEGDIDRWQWVGRYDTRQKRKVRSPRKHTVSFSRWKMLVVDYLRWLFKRAAAGDLTRIIAISPTNRVLLRQLRGLELIDDGSGRIQKIDDHLPDALIAGAKPIAVANQAAMPKRKQSVAPVDLRELAAAA